MVFSYDNSLLKAARTSCRKSDRITTIALLDNLQLPAVFKPLYPALHDKYRKTAATAGLQLAESCHTGSLYQCESSRFRQLVDREIA